MTEELDIILVGFELEQSQVEAGIVRVFGIEPRQAQRLLQDLPAIARSRASRALAERYVQALNSIGARVELRPTGSLSAPSRSPGIVSLPPPAAAVIARVDESLRVQRETARAIKRFRAAEGLPADSMHYVDPENPDLDLWNPTIPKAPLVPKDLARMRAAARSRLSDPPLWMSDPSELDAIDFETDRVHADAQLPPPIELDLLRGTTPGTTPGPAPAPVPGLDAATEVRPSDHSAVRPRRSVGLAHSATASIRPGLSPYYARTDAGPWDKKSRLRTLMPVVVVGLLALAALWFWLADSADHLP